MARKESLVETTNQDFEFPIVLVSPTPCDLSDRSDAGSSVSSVASVKDLRHRIPPDKLKKLEQADEFALRLVHSTEQFVVYLAITWTH